MKKFLAVILALAMILALTACGTAPAAEKKEDLASIQKDDIVPTQKDTEKDTEKDADDTEPESEPEPDESADTEPVDTKYTISGEVLVDNEDCMFTIKSAEIDKYGDLTLKVLCENKTADKTLMFYINDSAVNGYMVDGYFGEEVAAGKKANSTIDFYQDDLDECGIVSADKIEFVLEVSDSNDWAADPVLKEQFVIYPTGLTEDEVVIPARPTADNEVVVVDNEDFTFVILGESEDSYYNFAYNCYIENKTDCELMVGMDEVSVNGFMIDPYFGATMTAGNRIVTSISFDDDEMEENDIESIENIEFILYACDYDDWFADDLFRDTFVYEP